VACSLLTNVDDLSGGSIPSDSGQARDTSKPQNTDGGTVVVPLDASTADTSEPYVLYLPAPGKYEYVQNAAAYATGTDFEASAGELGVDVLTVVGMSTYKRAQAATMPARIDYTDGGTGACWTLDIQIHPSDSNGAHVEDETFCSYDGGVLDPGIRSIINTQVWNLGIFGSQSTTAVVDCSAANVYIAHAMKPGDSFMHTCMGNAQQTNGTYVSEGPYSYVGRESMNVAGVNEDVFHTLRTRTVIGATSGYEITDFYLSTLDALPLRIHRHTHIETPVTVPGISKVNYDEKGSDWIVTSHTPQ
jgi:hypothetical protein